MRKDARIRESNLRNADGTFRRSYTLGNKRVMTLEGSYHHNMMTRATNLNYKNKYPTYRDVSVSEEFKDFQYFAGWCHEQVGFGNLGWVLDKDCLCEGNKIYSSQKCIFIPDVINILFTKVYLYPRRNKYLLF